MAFFEALIPQFLREGRLTWLRAPLYKVTKGKKSYYFFTDEELEESKIIGEQVRYKGLGEMNAEDAEESMFNPEVQRLEVIMPTDEGEDLLNDLMGSDVEPKREFVFSHIDFTKLND